MAMPRPAPGTGRWWVIGAIGIALSIALVAWYVLHGSGNRITATTVGYKVVDDSSVRITFDVNRPARLPVTCTLSALDGHFTVVGRADVVIPPGNERTINRVETIKTTTRAVTGVVQDCVRT